MQFGKITISYTPYETFNPVNLNPTLIVRRDIYDALDAIKGIPIEYKKPIRKTGRHLYDCSDITIEGCKDALVAFKLLFKSKYAKITNFQLDT